MKPYSMDLRERVVAACDAREGTRVLYTRCPDAMHPTRKSGRNGSPVGR